jgi:hypothetical protein
MARTNPSTVGNAPNLEVRPTDCVSREQWRWEAGSHKPEAGLRNAIPLLPVLAQYRTSRTARPARSVNASSGFVDQLYEVDHSDRSIAPDIGRSMKTVDPVTIASRNDNQNRDRQRRNPLHD